jgi:hypothetical protein
MRISMCKYELCPLLSNNSTVMRLHIDKLSGYQSRLSGIIDLLRYQNYCSRITYSRAFDLHRRSTKLMPKLQKHPSLLAHLNAISAHSAEPLNGLAIKIHYSGPLDTASFALYLCTSELSIQSPLRQLHVLPFRFC